MKLNPIFVLLFPLLIQLVYCAIDYEVVANTRAETEFIVLNGNSLKLPNRHRRNQPYLKLSLHGTTIEKIETRNDTHWTLRLADKTVVELNTFEQALTTTFQLRWPGGGPNLEREICLHYAQDGVQW